MTFQRRRHRNVKERKLTESEYRKLHGIYTSPSDPAAFGSVRNLVKASGLPRSKVLAYLQSSSTYTKFRATKLKFTRLPVVSLGITIFDHWMWHISRNWPISIMVTNTYFLQWTRSLEKIGCNRC